MREGENRIFSSQIKFRAIYKVSATRAEQAYGFVRRSCLEPEVYERGPGPQFTDQNRSNL